MSPMVREEGVTWYTHHITLQSYEVHLDATRVSRRGVVVLDGVQQVSEELVTTFQDTQGHQWSLDVLADLLSQTCCPEALR